MPEDTHDAYALLGVCIVAIARLEHTIDKAIVAISRFNAKLVSDLHRALSKSKKPPQQFDDKIKLLVEYLEVAGEAGRPRLRGDFFEVARAIYDQRIRLLHSELLEWRIEPEDLSTSFFFCKYGTEQLATGRRRLVLQPIELEDSTLEALANISGQLVEELRASFPELVEIDAEISSFIDRHCENKRAAPNEF